MYVPVFRQSDRAECGLACIGMVAAFHGLVEPLSEHRRQFRVSQQGSTLGQLRNYAERRGFQCRAVRLEPSALHQLHLPAILHWDMSHFVVLEAVGRRRIRIVDPSVGRRRLSKHEVARHFTGVAMEALPTSSFAPVAASPRLRIRDFLPAFRGLGTSLVAVLIMTIAFQLLTLIAPLGIQLTVDRGVRQSDSAMVIAIAVGFAMIAGITSITQWLRALLILHVGNLAAFRMVASLARRLLRLPEEWFVSHHTGDIMSRFDSMDPIRQFVVSGAFGILIDAAVAVGASVVLVFYSPLLGGIALTFLALNIAVRVGTMGHLSVLTGNVINAVATERTTFIENVERQRSIKLLGIETLRGDVWEARYVSSINANARHARFAAHVDLAASVLRGAEPVSLLALGALEVLSGTFSLGMLFAFLGYSVLLSARARQVVESIVDLRLLRLHRERVAEIAVEETEASGDGGHAGQLKGLVEICGLTFAYGDGLPPVLSQMDLRVEPGEFVAVTGKSGVGKSTCMKLLCGLLQPQEGDVCIDGTPLRSYDVSSYRAQIGVVMQDDDLFTGTLAENIGLDDSDDTERVYGAAKAACIHDEIERMPMRYRTLAGYMGAALSGGQKQRVMIARAIFRRPSLLLLDEATAHLDEVTKVEVLAGIRECGASVVFFTHDPVVVGVADRHVELQRG